LEQQNKIMRDKDGSIVWIYADSPLSLSQEMIKTICDVISQEFYSWELKEENDGITNGSPQYTLP
jgi:hypothetical protein